MTDNQTTNKISSSDLKDVSPRLSKNDIIRLYLIRTCYHEAGHVFVAHKEGFLSAAAVIQWREDKQDWLGRRASQGDQGIGRLKVAAAGIASELHHWCRRNVKPNKWQLRRTLMKARQDRNTYEQLRCSYSSMPQFLICAKSMAKQFTSEDYSNLTNLAKELYNKKRMGNRTIQAILAGDTVTDDIRMMDLPVLEDEQSYFSKNFK